MLYSYRPSELADLFAELPPPEMPAERALRGHLLSTDLRAPAGDMTVAYPFEDAAIEDYSHPQHRIVGDRYVSEAGLQRDRQLVGLQALAFDAVAAGDFITFRFPAPESLRYRIRVRAKVGPDRGSFTLAVIKADGPRLIPLGSADTYAEYARDQARPGRVKRQLRGDLPLVAACAQNGTDYPGRPGGKSAQIPCRGIGGWVARFSQPPAGPRARQQR